MTSKYDSATSSRGSDAHPEHTNSFPAAEHAASVVELHALNEQRAGVHQRLIERITATIGRPWLLYGVLGLSVLWVGLGMGTGASFRFWDRPPFPILQMLWSFGSLLVATMVLITQNRQSRTQQRQAHLDLQISLLVDQKVTKVIDLLEQLRQDAPNIPNRVDPNADALRSPIDPRDLAADLEQRLDEVSRDLVDVETSPEGGD